MEKTEKLLLGIKRHSRYSLLALILKACKEPKAKSDLYFTRPRMFHYGLLGDLLEQATKLKLLEIDKNGKYHTTAKGNEYIRLYTALLKFLKPPECKI
jgi:predicted transcriptional regulator